MEKKNLLVVLLSLMPTTNIGSKIIKHKMVLFYGRLKRNTNNTHSNTFFFHVDSTVLKIDSSI